MQCNAMQHTYMYVWDGVVYYGMVCVACMVCIVCMVSMACRYVAR